MIRKYVFQIAGFLPLFVFVDVYILFGSWDTAFIAGGILAALQMVLFLINKKTFDRFMLAINLFLLVGAIGLPLRISFIENLYDHYMQTTLYIFLLIVGVLTTLFSPQGFIESTGESPRMIRYKSWCLVCATALALLFSYYFMGNLLLSGMVPFLGLIAIRNLLIKWR